ncbi:MAG: MerC family mercury resistance protein [Gammaproteobacteria bacterium]|nr:MerC family mercury resistance protein [Gammaproteobacteria bacterium]
MRNSIICLSGLCAIHCLMTPLIVVFPPSLAGLPLQDKAFHLWLVIAILPLIVYALTMGCKKNVRSHDRQSLYSPMPREKIRLQSDRDTVPEFGRRSNRDYS